MDGGRYKWLSYTQVQTRVADFAAALVARAGLRKGGFVSIYSTNCPEWVIASQACYRQSLVSVPLYDTLGIDSCVYILNQVKPSVIVVGEKQYPTLVSLFRRVPASR